ncbi:MAG: hybrid sensor histidine kinase/response regulator, partial [Oceanococcaceae bacterium]
FNRARPGDGLAALFRALHTLKGGARMAGLLQLGESAHDLETLVERLRGAGRPVEAAEQAQIQSAADGLRALREAAEAPLPGPSAAPAASESASSSIEGIPLIEGDADGMEWATETVHDTGADVVSRAGDTTRVQVSHLDGMLAEVGEISMFRSRLEQQLVGLGGQLREFDQTIERLRSQVRNLEVATDAQIQARASGQRQAQEEGDRYEAEFDPLEMDRYTRMQELTRSITETISDLGSLHRGMREAVGESEAMVLQQGRLSTSMQEGLLTTLAVPFSRQQNRLARVVRQAASENGRQAKLQLSGGETEMDRNVLERIVPALEHVLRNAIIHGIESPEVRTAAGKSPEGTVQILLQRESNRIVVEVRDDGGGLNHERIREVAVRRGLLAADAELSFDRIAQFIFEPGFSTAEGVSLAAGRGVGMDAVAAEVRQLGGSIDVASERGKGCRFLIRLPFSLAITQALQVRVADDDFIVPLPTISGVARMPAADIQAAMESDPHLDYGGVRYEVHALAQALGRAERGTEAGGYVPVLFVRTGADSGRGRNFAVVVDHLLGTREVVAKNVGRQLATVPGVAGASIQPDGRVVLILDLADLILDRERRGLRSESSEAVSAQKLAPLVMVIDDSITMRRVAERVLTRAGYRVALAKDGADGVAQLQTTRPDAVLLDIEMPRMDGFEVAGFMRHDDSLRDVPIVMITSRSGDKHRTRAADLGVNGYLVKPYQEQQLLAEVELQLREPQQLQVQA